MRRQHAPRGITILIAVVLIGVGVLGTFAEILPEQVGVWAYVAATALLLLGVFIEGI
ncbi:MAG: hypothetical protein H0V12_06825 [Chloroflexi bacterium]|nr:hypothetical protein [Chloroflexota bacterium]